MGLNNGQEMYSSDIMHSKDRREEGLHKISPKSVNSIKPMKIKVGVDKNRD